MCARRKKKQPALSPDAMQEAAVAMAEAAASPWAQALPPFFSLIFCRQSGQMPWENLAVVREAM